MIKKAIRKWLVPEYGETLLRLESFLNEIELAKEIVTAKDKDIKITGPVIFLGSLKDCTVKLNPNINPTIILSKFSMDSMLRVMGSHQIVQGCYLTGSDDIDKGMEGK